MKRLACLLWLTALPALCAPEPPPEARFYEKAMAPLGVEGWFTMMGNWDEEGRPVVLDLMFTHKADPDAMKRQFRSHHRVRLKEGNEVIDHGATVTQNTDGTGKQWFVYDALGQCCGVSHATEFRIITAGEKDLPGRLEFNTPGTPKLRIWEEAPGKIRWEVTEAWQVKVQATVNDGESWALLGAGNAGQCDLGPLLPEAPVLRITAFRGLKCFAEAFQPGQGFLPDPHEYLQPTYMAETWPNGSTSVWPSFNFSPEVNPPNGYQCRVKVHLNYNRLPFDLKKLFPGKFVQKVFQAEWRNPSAGIKAGLMMSASMLRDPGRWKGGWLYRIKQDERGGWVVEDPIFKIGPASEPSKSPGVAKKITVSGGVSYDDKIKKYYQNPLKADFGYYFVVVGI